LPSLISIHVKSLVPDFVLSLLRSPTANTSPLMCATRRVLQPLIPASFNWPRSNTVGGAEGSWAMGSILNAAARRTPSLASAGGRRGVDYGRIMDAVKGSV